MLTARSSIAALVPLFTLAGCGQHHSSAIETQQVVVHEGGDSLVIAQRFDERGELIDTSIVHRAGSTERVLRANGALLTGAGTTVSGDLVRTFFRGASPALLARLSEADARFDVAVLTADVLLELDASDQRAAARTLRGQGALCAMLGACAQAHTPGQT